MECVLTITRAASLAATPPCITQADCAHGGVPPILAAIPSSRPPSRLRWVYFVLLSILLLPVLCIVGIASYFHLSSSTEALRSAFMESAPGEWHKRFAVNVGYLTVGLARFGSTFFHLPPEARAALQAVDGGEVGVYEVKESMSRPDYAGILRTADKSMRRRGWERIVGVAQGSQFVAVYAPSDVRRTEMSCCVAVLDDQNLVVVSARGNISPLLDLAQEHLHEKGPFLRNF
jgi:hypothetical protein